MHRSSARENLSVSCRPCRSAVSSDLPGSGTAPTRKQAPDTAFRVAQVPPSGLHTSTGTSPDRTVEPGPTEEGGPLGLSTRFAKFRNGTEKCESGLVSYLVEMMTLRCWKRAMFRYRHCIFFKTPSFTNHIPFVFNVGCPTTRLRGSQKRAQSTARSGIRLTPSRWPQVNAIDDNP